MKSFNWLALTGCLTTLLAGGLQAQDKPATPAPPPDKPAGQGTPPPAQPEPPKFKPIDPAYEGLLAAIKRIEKNEAVQKGTQANANLYEKQAAIDDKETVKALDELHSWLAGNTAPTQDISYSISEPDSFFTALGGVNQLAQVLQLKQYVMLADGRVSDAIAATREGLRLATAVQNHGLIGCMTGFQVEDTVVLPLAQHLDQLSLHDCDRLLELAEDWDRTPNAIIFAMERERRGGIIMMQKLAGEDGQKLRDMLLRLPADALKADSDEAKIVAQLRTLDTKGWKDMTVRLAASVDKLYTQSEEDLQTPYWKREAPPTAPPVPKDFLSNVEGFMTASMKPQIRKLESAYATRQAYAHLLGVHAAIRHYQWEHNSLPPTLKELKIINLLVDPFTGNDLIYKVDKDTYTLASAGAVVYGRDGKPDPAARKPVTLAPKDPSGASSFLFAPRQ